MKFNGRFSGEPVVGQSAWNEGHKRTIKRLLKNIKGATIIEWESRSNIGAVLPSIWKEWLDGANPLLRRVNNMCVCEPKPRSRSGLPFAKRRY